MFSGQLYNDIKQLIILGGDLDYHVDSPMRESEQYFATSCLVGDLLSLNAVVVIMTFVLNQS